MSALLFFQIAALIVIFTLCSLLLSVALGWLYINTHLYMPVIMAAVQQGLEDVDDFDQHYEDNRQIINPIGENPFK